MPIYEYACATCEHRFETIQRASEDPLRDCPECAEPALKKLLSAPVFRLKGKGWYETDFKTGDKRNVLDSGNGASSGDGAGKENGKNADSNAKKDASGSKTAESSSGDGAGKDKAKSETKPGKTAATSAAD